MKFDIVRSWKDESYRQSLSKEQLEMLPVNPAGEEIKDTDLEAVFGGWGDAVYSGRHDHGEEGGDTQTLALLFCELNIATVNVLAIPITALNAGPSGNCFNKDA